MNRSRQPGTPDTLSQIVERLGQLSPQRLALLELLLHQQAEHDGQAHALSQLYDGLAKARPNPVRQERLLTYAPFFDVVPDFSWLLFLVAPEHVPAHHAHIAYQAQLAMRQVLFRHVDFSTCRTVLDFGCGYGADLLALADQYPQLQLDGYTLSAQQATIAQAKIQAWQLTDRVHVYQRNSATHDFPAQYDVAFGFEVVHHIPNKNAVFANLSRHIHDTGLIVLADFVSHVASAIEDHASPSFFIPQDQWAEVLSHNGLAVIDCVDVSPQIANFLTDPDFAHNLSTLESLQVAERVRAAFQAYHRGGELLRKGLASYVLLTIQKQSHRSQPELAQATQDILSTPQAYAAISPQGWLYQPVWQPQPRQSQPADRLAALASSLANGGAKHLSPLAQAEWQAYQTFIPQLERVVRGYVRQAFYRLGWSDTTSAAQVERAAQAGVLHKYQRLLGRLLTLLGQDNVGPLHDPTTMTRDQTDQTPPLQDLHRQVTDLKAHYPFAGPELVVVERCGPQLAEVLRGEADGLELVFPGGDLSLVTSLYQDAIPFRTANTIASTALAELLASRLGQAARPGPIRVLEIGAGTGSTTAALLTGLSSSARQHLDYVFTDVSPVFVRKAGETFGDSPFLRYGLLDIEQPPESQGFASGQFDIIVAANVLHATADLHRTLAHVDRLLTPDGALLLVEITQSRCWLDLSFGLLEGWWKFQDMRPGHPLLSTTQWRTVLAESGFDSVTTVPLAQTAPDQGPTDLDISVMLASRAAAEQTPASGPAVHWIIFEDSQGIGEALATKLEDHGDVCTRVQPAAAFAQRSPHQFELNPKRKSDFTRLFDTLCASPLPVQGIVHLWSLEPPALHSGQLTTHEPSPALAAHQHCTTFLHLTQAVLDKPLANGQGSTRLPTVWVVTQGAVPAELESALSGLGQSAVWGMAGVIDWEHPEFGCKRVDLPPLAVSANATRDTEPSPAVLSAAEALVAELRAPSKEDRIALRGQPHQDQARYVERFVRRPAEPIRSATQYRVQPNASYLITGGFGGLGLHLAEWLVQQGARHLALIGRHPPSAAAVAKLQQLAATGAHVFTAYADVSVAHSFLPVLVQIDQELPPLRGVVHAAGMLDDGIILQLNASRFARVMAPKVNGAWLLHEWTRERELDFFALFSSTASLLGNPGQANHAAANAFLDALAHYRQSLGLPAISINWGAWAEIGAAAKGQVSAHFQLKGINPIPPQAGLDLFAHILCYHQEAENHGQPLAQVGVVPVDWRTFLQTYRAGRGSPFFAAFAAETPPRPHQTRPDTKSRLGPPWQHLPAEQRTRQVRDFVGQLTAKALGAPVSQLDPDLPFNKLGLDSLMAVEMRHALQTELGIDVSIVTLMQDLSLARLVEELQHQLETTNVQLDGTELIEGEL